MRKVNKKVKLIRKTLEIIIHKVKKKEMDDGIKKTSKNKDEKPPEPQTNKCSFVYYEMISFPHLISS